MEYYIVTEAETGEFKWAASGPIGDADRQILDDGLVASVVTETEYRAALDALFA